MLFEQDMVMKEIGSTWVEGWVLLQMDVFAVSVVLGNWSEFVVGSSCHCASA